MDRRFFLNFAYRLEPFDDGVFRARTRPGQSVALGAYLRNAGLQADSYRIELTADLPWVVADSDGDGINDGLEVGRPDVAAVPIDFDGDGQIDALETGEEAYSVVGDMDGDGRIDVRDYRGLAVMCNRPRCAKE